MFVTRPFARTMRITFIRSLCAAAFLSSFLSACIVSSGSLAQDSVQQQKVQIERKSPGIMKRYDAFYIGDIRVYSLDQGVLQIVDDREVRELADDLRVKLIRSLGNSFSPIPQRTRNTAVIHVGLTNVATTHAAFQLIPGQLFPNALRGGATIEARVVDSVSNEVVLSMKDSRQGQREGYLSGLGKWDGAQRAFDEWAQMLSGAVAE